MSTKTKGKILGHEAKGGIHIERLNRTDCAAEGFDPSQPWIRVVITDDKTEQEAIINETTARALTSGIIKLLGIKL